ncbi:MAG TPA: DUF3566 domain-containing protein [Candidatus Acidoferrum sp.]|jgi:hypothetical protein
MATVKRIGPGSAFKIGMVMYALIGLLLGCFFAAISGIAGSLATAHDSVNPFGRMLGMGMGFGAVIFFPILYGVIGGVFAALGAVVYNLVSGWIGGLEVDIS